MSDLYFDVVKRWAVDEWYDTQLVIYRGGHYSTPLMILSQRDVEKLIATWTEKRNRKVGGSQ